MESVDPHQKPEDQDLPQDQSLSRCSEFLNFGIKFAGVIDDLLIQDWILDAK